MNAIATKDGTVGKALEVLDLVAKIGRPVRFRELLGLSILPKATLYRFLQTLTSQRMLSYDSDKQTYNLGVRLVSLAHAAWKQSSLAPIARPFIDRLASKVGETIHLAQMVNGQVLYVDKQNATQPIEMFSQAGKVGPGYCTGIGKAIMAFMDDDEQLDALNQQTYFKHTENTFTSIESLKAELDIIRRTSISFDREEHEANIICIAAPILSGGTRVIGGLSITSSKLHHSIDYLEGFQEDLLDTARNIGIEATNWQFPT